MPQHDEKFRFKPLPLLITIALGIGIPVTAALLTKLVLRSPAVMSEHSANILPWLYMQHGFQLVLALVAIAIVRRLVPTDYGLHMPRERTYLGAAVFWGFAFGVLMLLIDYAPQLLTRNTPKLEFPLTTPNVIGWLAFEGIYVGPTEEIPFRALLVTYLAATMPGRLRVGGFEMNWAGVIVALFFALLHADNFATRVWPLALGQQIYAFALGVLYAYWLEKSGSVLASSVGHNVSDVTEYALLFAWVALS